MANKLPYKFKGTVPLFREADLASIPSLGESKIPAIVNTPPMSREQFVGPRKPKREPLFGKGFREAVTDVVPYLSNISAAFQRPPEVPVPETITPVSLQRYSFDKERRDIDKAVRAADLGAESGLSAGSTIAAVKASNLARKLGAYSNLAKQEADINTQIANQEAMTNLGVGQQNTALWNQYRQQGAERAMAYQTQQSENLANAADKFIAQRTAKRQAELDKEKWKIYSPLFERGLLERTQTKWTGAHGGKMKKLY